MAVDTIARALAIKAQQGGGSGGTSDYQELTNKPSINGVTLEGNKTSSDLGIETGVTEEQLTQTIAQEAAARQKQDSLLEEEIADKLAPSNIKAGDGINLEQSGMDVTISSNIYYYNWGLLSKTSDTSEEGKAFWTSIYNKCLAGEHPIVITTVEQFPTAPVSEYTVQLIGVPTALTEEETSFYKMAYKTAPVRYTNENGSFRWYQLCLHFTVQDGVVTQIGKSRFQDLPLLLDFQTSPERGYPNNLALSTGNTREFIPTSDYNPATKKYVDDIVSTISTLSFQVVATLPTEDIKTNVIYLVPSTTSSEQNVYDEYIYINNAWEKIGSTAIDLSNYLAKDNTAVYTPTGDYNPATKQYVDNSITSQATTSETISGLKTFTTLPESSVVPTTDNQFVNKAYVDQLFAQYQQSLVQQLSALTTPPDIIGELSALTDIEGGN